MYTLLEIARKVLAIYETHYGFTAVLTIETATEVVRKEWFYNYLPGADYLLAKEFAKLISQERDKHYLCVYGLDSRTHNARMIFSCKLKDIVRPLGKTA